MLWWSFVVLAYGLVAFFSIPHWETQGYGAGKSCTLAITWPIWAVRGAIRYFVEHWKEG